MWVMCMCGVGVVLSLCTPSFTRAFAFSFPNDSCVCSDFVDGDFVCGSKYLMYDCYNEEFVREMIL